MSTRPPTATWALAVGLVRNTVPAVAEERWTEMVPTASPAAMIRPSAEYRPIPNV